MQAPPIRTPLPAHERPADTLAVAQVANDDADDSWFTVEAAEPRSAPPVQTDRRWLWLAAGGMAATAVLLGVLWAL